MPYITGGELYKVFKAQQRFEESTIKFYASQLVQVIGYLHSNGIVHRDLKLENILLDSDGYLKLIDFGLSTIVEEGHYAFTLCGTPEYLSPEIV